MNEIPDIYYDDSNKYNPCIFSPNAPYAIFFEQTKETLFGDAELFKRFAENVVKNFRSMKVYSHYKAYLYDIGLDRCQILGNITNDMAKIEMHHNGLTIFDLTIIITTHLLNVNGKTTTFEVINHLRHAHINNEVPIVMLCKTMHQLEHNDDNFYIPIQMTFGHWDRFLEKYPYGMTYGICKKVNYWIKKSLSEQVSKGELNSSIIELNQKIRDWSGYNESGYNSNSTNNIYYPFINGLRYSSLY